MDHLSVYVYPAKIVHALLCDRGCSTSDMSLSRFFLHTCFALSSACLLLRWARAVELAARDHALGGLAKHF